MGDVSRAIEFFAAVAGLSVAATLALVRLAHIMGMVDTPGGRKAHAHPVPLVGGLAIFASVLVGATILGLAPRIGHFLLALSVIIAVGLWDDVTDLRPRLKLALQIVASSIMVWGAGVELRTVGDLFGYRPIGLWVFVVPMTMFAVVGVVNAVNMIDGMDGLGGTVAITAFAWYAVVAADSGLDLQYRTALIFCASIAGFLLLNVRLPWQSHARVFLGDAGSLMLGFALGWLAIDLTQGDGRTFPPIAALWVVLLPLADCVSLILRRVTSRKSPFDADCQHIHHYLLARGFDQRQTLAILAGISVLFGAVGYFGWKLGVPEPVLFYPFFFGFFGYHFWISREWERIERRTRGIPSELPFEQACSNAD